MSNWLFFNHYSISPFIYIKPTNIYMQIR